MGAAGSYGFKPFHACNANGLQSSGKASRDGRFVLVGQNLARRLMKGLSDKPHKEVGQGDSGQ